VASEERTVGLARSLVAVSILALGRVFVANMTGNVVFATFAVALGAQNAVARRLAVPDLTTTVLTMTLTGVGAELRSVLRGTGPAGAGREAARATHGYRLLAVSAMVAGAAAGASLVLWVSPLSALALAAALLAAVALWAALATRRPAAWRAFPAGKS